MGGQHRLRLVVEEAQLAVPDVAHPAFEAQPREVQGGVGARAEDDPQRRGRPPHQQVEGVETGRVADQVDVVEEQPDRVRDLPQHPGETADERRDGPGGRARIASSASRDSAAAASTSAGAPRSAAASAPLVTASRNAPSRVAQSVAGSLSSEPRDAHPTPSDRAVSSVAQAAMSVDFPAPPGPVTTMMLPRPSSTAGSNGSGTARRLRGTDQRGSAGTSRFGVPSAG